MQAFQQLLHALIYLNIIELLLIYPVEIINNSLNDGFAPVRMGRELTRQHIFSHNVSESTNT
jgi:hypothetical protein